MRLISIFVLLAAILGLPTSAPAKPAGCSRGPTSAAEMNAAVVDGIDYSDSFRTDVLPDGRWMSVTGDTALTGQVYPASNSVVIWDRTGQRRTAASGNFFPGWPDGSNFWPGQWVTQGNTAYVVGSRQKITGPFEWTTLGAYIAVVSVPWCGTPTFSRYLTTPSSGLGDTAVQWSGGITRSGGWFWIHGLLDRPDQLHARDGGYIARASNLAGTWRFWTGSSWSTDSAAAVSTIPTPGGTESAYTVNVIAGQWTVTTKRGGSLASTVGQYTSTSPAGPWTWTPLISTCDIGCYLAGAAPIPTTSGRLMVEWSRTNAMPQWAEL